MPLYASVSAILSFKLQKRSQLRKKGIRPQFLKRVYKSKKHRGRPILKDPPRFLTERDVLRGLQRKYRRLVVRWERQSFVFDNFFALATIRIWINKILLVG